jgi:predicted CXXCH cytochrome family protein
MDDYAFLHWPDFTDVGECQECHAAKGNEHQFSMTDAPALCMKCHEELEARIETAKTVHEPVEDGCDDCHDPHGGTSQALLLPHIVYDDMRSICFECHEDDIMKEEVVHGPADLGACHMCHDPHASAFDLLLRGEGVDLCAECHEEIATSIHEAKLIHDPAEEDCTNCHDPHSGPFRKMLFADGRALCKECHDDIVEQVENAKVDHAPTKQGGECINCHAPHAANSAPMLRKPQRDLCLGCHDEPIKSGRKRLTDIRTLLSKNKEWHKPVVEDDCSGCHQAHGSVNFRLLKEPYPARFYTKEFDVREYALCFSCHEDSRVTEQWTRTQTGFRDGNRNMHFLHVNREKRGRTCRACHEVHASAYPLHLRELVPYGKWMMPLNFEKDRNGGSCHPGCHKIKHYDRNAKDFPDSQGED